MAVYAESEDLINVGAYHSGSNPAIDEAIAKHQSIEEFLIQAVDEASPLEETFTAMEAISGVSIPPEETAGSSSGAVSGGESKKIAGKKIPPVMSGSGNMMAQSSVASLFAGRGFENFDAAPEEGETPVTS
jgi:hypothetical protein